MENTPSFQGFLAPAEQAHAVLVNLGDYPRPASQWQVGIIHVHDPVLHTDVITYSNFSRRLLSGCGLVSVLPVLLYSLHDVGQSSVGIVT